MIFKNSVQLNYKNLEKVWKYFFFRIVIWGVIILLSLPAILKFSSIFSSNAKTYDLFGQLGSGFLYVKNYGLVLTNLFDCAFQILKDCFETSAFLVIYFCIVFFLLKPFLLNIGKYTMNYMFYYYMSSHTRCKFINTMVCNLKEACAYSFFKTLFCLPVMCLNTTICCLLVSIDNNVFTYLKPLVVIIVFIVVYSIAQSVLSGWAPAMIVLDCNVFKGFVKGFSASWKMIGMILLNYLVIYLCYIVVPFALSIYTLVVVKPFIVFNIVTHEMIAFYNVQGMKYYVGNENIVIPKKLEEIDKFKKSKYIL